MAEAQSPGPYWFTVRYGAAQQTLFNADCWAVVLADYLKERCGYGDLAEPVDLQREDGTCVNLMEAGKSTATALLQPKGTYTLCKVVQTEDGAPPTYEVLWEAPEGSEPPPPAAAAKGKK